MVDLYGDFTNSLNVYKINIFRKFGQVLSEAEQRFSESLVSNWYTICFIPSRKAAVTSNAFRIELVL